MLRRNRSALIRIGIDAATPQAQLPETTNTPPHITKPVCALPMPKTSRDKLASTPVVSRTRSGQVLKSTQKTDYKYPKP